MSSIAVGWVDLRTNRNPPSPVPALPSVYQVFRVADVERVVGTLDHQGARVVCFEFDFPELAGLQALRHTKGALPSVPIVMLTTQHSEALALWALRTRVWDYLVKPIPEAEFAGAIDRLIPVLAQPRGAPRANLRAPPPVPDEARLCAKGRAKRTAAAIHYIDSHYAETIRIADVATLCGIGVFEFSRAFKRDQGMNFREYLVQRRLQQAVMLLSNPHASIAEVAFAAGFHDSSYFTRVFHRLTGITPSAYRLTRQPTKPEQESTSLSQKSTARPQGST